MKLPTLLCVAVLTVRTVLSASVVPKLPASCDGAPKEEVLAEGLNRPYQLSYHYHEQKDLIFFSNNVGSDKEDKFEIKRLYNNTMVTIEGVENGFATAISDEKEFAYFGGSSGIYKMHLANSKIEKIINDYDVWDLFFKKHLYFIEYSSQKLYKVKHPKSNKKDNKNETHEAEHEKWIHEKIYQFVIDGDDDIFFTNKTGLFMIKNGTQHRIHIPGETVFRAIEINHKGVAFFVGRNGIYRVKKEKSENILYLIADIKNTFGLTFDNDDMIIYSNPLKIIKLIIPHECDMSGMVSKSALPVSKLK